MSNDERCNLDTMANAEHAPAMAPPIRTDEQILPRIRWKRTCKYGDSNGYTFDDPILILEILSRRFLLRGIYLIT
ncbi:hypothetical protein Tco_1481868, partial [Tanacetum coccineum]